MSTPLIPDRKLLDKTRWRLDPAGSTAAFAVPHFWGLVTVRGHFESLDGRLEINGSHQRLITLTIDATSLRTGNRRRDIHLRSAAFFDTQNHAEVRFHSTRVSDVSPGRLRVEGELEAAGGSARLELEAGIRQLGDGLEIDAVTTIDQRKLGMTWSPWGMTRTPTTLTIRARLLREP
jgi:polyisoprenoid-binding protein YceI